jgi:fumarate hydratase subunit beta
MRYRFSLPISKNDIKKLNVGDIIYISGCIFTARDVAHKMLLETDINTMTFDPSRMALFHCGPLIKENKQGYEVLSAGPTTSSRMELFENEFIKNFNIQIIIGKGGMGEKTRKALQKYGAVYTSYPGGAGVLAADKITEVVGVYWLEELGMTEAIWLFKVKDFGPLVVGMDSKGKSLYIFK